MSKVIVVTSRKYGKHEVIVDDEDFDRLKTITWTLQVNKKSGRVNICGWVNGHTEKIQRYILMIPYRDTTRVVWIDRNPLNNQKNNLKIIESQKFVELPDKILLVLRSRTFGCNKVYFDTQFLKRFKGMTWRLFKGHKTLYAATIGKNNHVVFMHRLILNAGVKEVDHKDGNGLNNMTSNLRPATRSQNKANRSKASSNTSGYKGVFFDKSINKFKAILRANKISHYGGSFHSKEAAAKRYNELAILHHKEFSNLNKI